MWFSTQLEPDSSLYHRPLLLRLRGSLDPGMLERSLDEILRRHEVLRTRYPARAGSPWQEVIPAQRVHLPLVDLSRLPAVERDAQAKDLADREFRRPFDLSQGLPLRARLLRLALEEHVLLLVIHHIAFDGWSTQVLLRELGALYQAFIAGCSSPLSELRLQYADYAEWQRACCQGPVLDRELAYWRRRLSGAPALLGLPTDRPRPPVQRHEGGHTSFTLPTELITRLTEFGRRERATLFMVLLAGFKALLCRYAGQTDVVVGIPIAGRTRVEWEHLIGCFANTLVLRTDLGGDPSFRELLARVRENALSAFEHQDVPFERLVEELHPERSLGHHPLFQVLFNFRNFSGELPGSPWIRLERDAIESQTALVDLSVDMIRDQTGWRCKATYDTQLFDATTIERLVGHYRTLLAQAAANPEEPLSTLPVLEEKERHRILVEWNATGAGAGDAECIHHGFEAQTRRTPEAVAVVFRTEQLSYRELDRSANRLAHRLKALGVGPEVRVGLLLDRSLDLPVALLAVLKAGGAYVPLDPDYPPARLRFMAEDAQARVVLTHEHLAHALPAGGYRRVLIDHCRGASLGVGEDIPSGGVGPDNLAYVMYTSGSTGQPKGVLVTHRSVANHLAWRQRYFPLSPSDRLLQTASLNFDDSVWEFLEPLLSGARVIMAEPGAHQDSGYLVRVIAEHQVTAACFVPSLLERFLAEPGVEGCGTLRRVTTGGEALPAELQRRVFDRLRSELYNGYGPTEATIASTFWHCTREPSGRVPIGRPISNTEVYVLDRHCQPVPVGAVGELYLGGVGLARGYTARPGLTAAAFIPHPFAATPGARLYRTGDLGRYREDGTLEFLGRRDLQVKVRGVRIEPGEVEAVLRRHPALRAAAVLAREDRSGDKQLVAYVVPQAGQRPGQSELRRFLEARLPAQMVPSMFMPLEALPLLPSGKLDAAALPGPDRSRPWLEEELVEPRSELEATVARIWMEVLGLDRVGVHDNFFALGGHSLRATQVVSRIREALRVTLPLRVLFEAPTVAGLAARLDVAQLGGV